MTDQDIENVLAQPAIDLLGRSYIDEQRAKLADQLVKAADHLIICDIEQHDPVDFGFDGAGI